MTVLGPLFSSDESEKCTLVKSAPRRKKETNMYLLTSQIISCAVDHIEDNAPTLPTGTDQCQ